MLTHSMPKPKEILLFGLFLLLLATAINAAEVGHYQLDDLSNGQRDGILRDSSGNHLHASGRDHRREDIRRIPCTELSTVAATDACASGFVEPNRAPLGQTDQHEKARPSCFASVLDDPNSQILAPSYPAFDFEYETASGDGGRFTLSSWVKPPAGGNAAANAGDIITVISRGQRQNAFTYGALTGGCLTRDCTEGYELNLTRVCRIGLRVDGCIGEGGVQNIALSDSATVCGNAEAIAGGLVSPVQDVEYRWIIGFNASAKFEDDAPVLPVPDTYAPIESLGYRTCGSVAIGLSTADVLTDGDDTFVEENQWAHVASMFDVTALINTVTSATTFPFTPTFEPAIISFENGVMRGWAPFDPTNAAAVASAVTAGDRVVFSDEQPLAIGNATNANRRRLTNNNPQNVFGGSIDEVILDDTADSTCETNCVALNVSTTTYSSATVAAQFNDRITPPYPACPVRRRYVSYEDDYVQ